MAITYGPNVIYFAAAAEAVTGEQRVQAVVLDHTSAANAVLTDTAGVPFAVLRTSATNLGYSLQFPTPVQVRGITVAALSAGKLYVYLA